MNYGKYEQMPGVISHNVIMGIDFVTINVARKKVEDMYECYSFTIRDCSGLAEAFSTIHASGMLDKASAEEIYETAKQFCSVDYDTIVSALVNAEYPTDKMQAIQNNFLETLVQDDEFKAMQAYRAHAKEIAKAVIAMSNEKE